MTHPSSQQVRRELAHQHVALEERLDELVHLADRGDPRALDEAWSGFESALLEHLELEEKQLFPIVEPAHPDEVRLLAAAHDRIRDAVSELGLACELHALHRPTLERLARMIRVHSEHEDAGLYHWVDELAPLDTRRHLLGLLVKTARATVGSQPAAER